MSGETSLNTKLKNLLTRSLPSKTHSLSEYDLVKINSFPSQRVKIHCDDFSSPEWSCVEKAKKCRLVLREMMNNIVISKHRLKHGSELPLLGAMVGSICTRSLQFRISLIENTIICSGSERIFELGLVYCQTFYDCVDISLLALSKYRAETRACLSNFGSDQNQSIIYHFAEPPLLGDEYVEKTVALPAFSDHLFGQCLDRTPIVNVRKPWKGDKIVCRRRTNGILQSLELLPSCHDFISTCIRIFKCLESLQPCHSTHYGVETDQGFMVSNELDFDRVFDAVSCYHWAVELKEDKNGGGSVFCAAKQIFKVKSFPTFCESYEWMCVQILNCIKDREVCRYAPNSLTNHSIKEQVGIGIYNFQMPEFPERENPRNYVRLLYQCNLVHGFPHRVFLYFTTVSCRQIHGCQLDVFHIRDKWEFERKASNVLLMYRGATPSQTIHDKDLITMWACKRDALSSAACSQFLEICHEIKQCMVSKTLIHDEPENLPFDDTCFSPLPVSTLNPIPDEDPGGRGYFPGILGASISYILPLTKEYPRVFERLQYDGYEKFVGIDLKIRRTNLFFNLFLEDCRYKHQFEGFLIEPYFVNKVDYLICSVPFGIHQYGQNSLVKKGCNQMRQACEDMKRCYVHHAEYFGFHSFFNENIFSLATAISVAFVLTLATSIAAQLLHPMKIIGMERFVEYFVYAALGITGISMVAFSVENSRVLENEKAAIIIENVAPLPILRLCWHIASFLLTVGFHIYIICFTGR